MQAKMFEVFRPDIIQTLKCLAMGSLKFELKLSSRTYPTIQG